ncbi:FecR family protein [Achromobacter aloeverae]
MTPPAPPDTGVRRAPHDMPPSDSDNDSDSNSDSQDFDRFAREHDPLDIEAATWVARRRNGLDADGEAELEAWLAADPRHRAAYEDMDDTFGRLRDMPQEQVQSLRSSLPPKRASAPAAGGETAPAPASAPAALPGRQADPAGAASPLPPRLASPARRDWLAFMGRFMPPAAAAAVLGAAGGGWLGWEWWRGRPAYAEHFATVQGQQTAVDLPDGSHIDLDAATRIAVELYPDRREVVLSEGQAMFSVQADPACPFHVVAGNVRVTVVGTRFSVRHTQAGLDAGKTRVAVEQGRVRVARLDGNGKEMATDDARSLADLTPGQSVLAEAQGYLDSIQAVGADRAAPWRAGRIDVEGAPLAQVLAEFERYGATGVVVRDPAVAALRVGGSFKVNDFPGFLRILPTQLPVRLQRQGGVTELVGIR